MRKPRSQGLLALLLVVLVGVAVRVQGALRDPGFDRRDATGMLVTDPGLLFYLTRRTVEAGGPPADLRADPRLEHPDRVDALARVTYGQELVVLAARRVVGEGVPLHVLCTWVFAVVMALAAAPLYGLALELTRSHRWAAVAAAAFALLPANHRTLGFVLMREDLALPLFALHLWLAARAVRVRTARAGALAGLALGAALAGWHAMGMVALLEAAALLGLLLITGRAPLSSRTGVAGLLGLTVVCLFVPALAAKGALLSPATALLWSVAAGGRLARRRAPAALALFALLLAASFTLTDTGDLRHVGALLLAKLAHLGVRPSDPGQLSFEARMMWQGPFATLTPAGAWAAFQFLLPVAAALVLVGQWRLHTRRAQDLEGALHLGFVLALLAAWLVSRLVVLPGLLLPVLFARAAQRSGGSGASILPGLGVLGLGFLQLVAFASWLSPRDRGWYSDVRPAEVAAALRAVAANVPAGEAVAADFMTSGALLAHADRPVVLSPKWETAASRERVRRFWHALYRQTPATLRELVAHRWQASWLLVDRRTLWLRRDSRYLAGLDPLLDLPPPGTASAALLSRDPAPAPAGYRLVWSGPGESAPRFRLYALD